MIYADFECFTENISSCQRKEDKSFTYKYQKHKPSGYCLMINDDKLFTPTLQKYTAKSENEF